MKLLAFALAATATILTACSSGTPGIPVPTSSDTGNSTTNPYSAVPTKAPPVSQPLDATAMVQTPCSSLTPNELATLNLTNPVNRPDVVPSARSCGWTDESADSVGIGWETVSTNGLTDVYKHVQATGAVYFIPTNIDGYPAAFVDSFADDRARGDCTLDVGVNDHLYFEADFDDSHIGSKACDFATQAARDVIANLKGGAPR